MNVKSIFFLLYDEYVKFYDPNLNVNIQYNVLQAKPPSTRIGKRYQMLFQKIKKARDSSSSTQSLNSEFQSYLTTTFEFVDSPDLEIL